MELMCKMITHHTQAHARKINQSGSSSVHVHKSSSSITNYRIQ